MKQIDWKNILEDLNLVKNLTREEAISALKSRISSQNSESNPQEESLLSGKVQEPNPSQSEEK